MATISSFLSWKPQIEAGFLSNYSHWLGVLFQCYIVWNWCRTLTRSAAGEVRCQM